jgi:glycosyltransferase involved in cell wall biosynthesis
METASSHGRVGRIAILGNHVPRQCGIATFTTDLADALDAGFPQHECLVMAMNDVGMRHQYPARVRFELEEEDPASYQRAADFLNVSAVGVLSVQHEYGIYGGQAGSYLLPLLKQVSMPIVTTLHTVLSDPEPLQKAAMDELVRISERLVVMSAHGAELLNAVHAVPIRKIDLIPHGIPDVPVTSATKDQLGIRDQRLILTFGLLAPDKGIEYVIDALPEILARFPDTTYVVLGTTHPHVKQRHGEVYREGLERRALKLGVAANVVFHNRFVSLGELKDFIAAADIYITPYLKPEQITSGTLAYAVGSGKAAISTPYSYARELLAQNRGILVPWRDPAAIAREVVGLLGDPARLLALRRRAAELGREMRWPAVARRYMLSFERARIEYTERNRTVLHANSSFARRPELPPVSLAHLQRMTDSTGLLQHAIFDVPRYEDGYCLDDNARALLLMAQMEDAQGDDLRVVRALKSRYLAFVAHALNYRSGRFRNLMSYSRTWTEESGSEDSHGRALWALGTVVGRGSDPGRQSLSSHLFRAALAAGSAFTSPRAWAFILLGIDEYLQAFPGDRDARALHETLAYRLFDQYRQTSAPDWPWLEERLTYSNAHLSQALIVSGYRLARLEIAAAGLRSLEWLASIQRSEAGYFVPIGSNGFYPRGQPKAAFDQQPVEAGAMVSACLQAERATGDADWLERARMAFTWFLGQNQLREPLCDVESGGCRDGLHADRVNQNQGAESTLAYLLALSEMRSIRRGRAQVSAAGEAAQ